MWSSFMITNSNTQPSASSLSEQLSATVNLCNFSLDHYEKMLENALGRGFTITSFRDFQQCSEKIRKVIILRHDLDYGKGLPTALRMAEIERKLGVLATYFIRVHSPEYNPFEHNTYQIIKGIIEMGHEIGLHFEAYDFHAHTGEDELTIIKREKEILEKIFDIKIQSAAEHGENHRLSKPNFQPFFAKYSKAEIALTCDAYDFQLNPEMKYLSDSDGRWREGCLCSHLSRYSKFHVLMHPEWWGHWEAENSGH